MTALAYLLISKSVIADGLALPTLVVEVVIVAI